MATLFRLVLTSVDRNPAEDISYTMGMAKLRWALLLALPALAAGQDRAAVERWVAGHQRAVMTEFTELLSIPDVGADRPNIRRNAEFLRGMLERHGLKAELLGAAGHPRA